jgi:hypothetical protein
MMMGLLLVPIFSAQTDSGRVRGAVHNQAGGALTSASVILTSVENGRIQTATTGNEGFFDFVDVAPGSYKIEATASGFQKQTADFDLELSQTREVNFDLKPQGEQNAAGVSQLDLERSSTGLTISTRQISDLPLNGRNFTQLALLTPGVTRGAYGDEASGVNNGVDTFRNGETGGAALSVNGLRAQANNFILDGIDNNESLVNTINFFTPVEAIREFRVTTSVAPAEFGRAGGTILQSSIKSGTNAIHGSAFWFLRSSTLDANNDYFGIPDPVTGKVRKLPFRRSQFGGTVGMPLIKDKLFIFGDYQGLRQDRPLNPELATVPTQKMRNGDFSELLGTGFTTTPAPFTGCGVVPFINGAIYNPLTCAPFPGNIIPAGQINQAGLNYIRAFPLPNLPGILHNFKAVRHDIRQFNDFDVRLDYNVTPNDTVFARYSYGQDTYTLTPRLGTLSSGFGSGTNNTHPRGLAFGEVHSFASSLANDFRFGYSRPLYAFIFPFNNTPQAQSLGIANANRLPQLGGTPLIGGFNTELEFTGDGGPFIVPQAAFQYSDTVSWARGKHAVRFGMNLIRRQVDYFLSDFRSKGFFNIGPGTGDFTGYEVSELLAGFIDNYSVSSPNRVYTRSWETGFFGQDDWKVTSRLTLNLGLRYDFYANPYEIDDRWSNFDLTTGTLKRAGVGGNSRNLVANDPNNWGPRLGFAYDVTGSGHTVLRGGYGIFYFLDRGGVGNQLSQNPDWTGSSILTASSGARITLSGQGPLFSNNNQLATQPLPQPVTSVVNDALPTNTSVIAVLPNNKNSSIQQWNLQAEHQFGPDTVLNVGYVGTKADHLMTWFNYTNNQLAPNAAAFSGRNLQIFMGGADGTSHYNGLHVLLSHHSHYGLRGTLAYTWSHAIDNSGSSLLSDEPLFLDAAGRALISPNKGNADNDQRHTLVLSSIYELPFGHGRHWGSNWSGVVDHAFGGWQFNNIISVGTGTPININIGAERPDLVGRVSTGSLQARTTSPFPGAPPARQWISAAPFTFVDPPQVGGFRFTRPGTIGRNRFYGPGYGTWDTSLFKNFALTERVTVQFRAEAFNVLNHPQYAQPDPYLGFLDPVTGRPSNTDFGLITSTRAFSSRQLQFAFRFLF